MVTALARFGTWSGLQVTASSGSDVYPLTQTFSFRTAKLNSPYISFHSVEEYTNIPASGGGYTPLQKPTAEESAVANKYNSPTYLPNATQGSISYPFIDLNNQALISSASDSPGLLTSQSHEEIAGNLTDTNNPATQAILGTANYISAVVCASTKQQPTAVCTSSGVQTAAKALKLGRSGLRTSTDGQVDEAMTRLRWQPLTTLILSVIGLGVATYLTIVHFDTKVTLSRPAGGGIINCEKVTTSAESYLFGIPVAVLGLAFFVPMIVLCLPVAWRSTVRPVHWARLALATTGVAMIIYLISAELLRIKAIRLWCTSVHVITFALFVIIATSAPIVLARDDGWYDEEDGSDDPSDDEPEYAADAVDG